MIQSDGTTRKIIRREEVSFRDVMSANRYRKARNVFSNQVDMLIREDTIVSHERILWSHMRGYYGLIREDTMVSHERILWSHMRGYYGLI
ncbi:hypothetical protein CLI78_01385 [Porphyromonas gingivalis]|nr:hypothetical protein CLI78_01385 [Porphyromonas gingivalis]